MKTLETFFYSGLKSLHFGKQVLRYLMVFLSAFFRQRASLGCELVALRSQLTFYKESIRQRKQPRPRFHPAFRLLWILLSRVWGGWKFVAALIETQDGSPMEAGCLSAMVALEIPAECRATSDQLRYAGVDPTTQS